MNKEGFALMMLKADFARSQVKKIDTISSQYVILSLSRPNGFDYRAGQYTHLCLADDQGEFERIYSIASFPSDRETVQFCIQVERDGRGAAFFKSLSVGSVVALGPASGQFSLNRPHSPLIFMAGGSGISPLRSMIRELLSQHKKGPLIQLFFGCRDARVIPFRDEWGALANQNVGRFQCFFFADQGIEKGVSSGNILQALKNRSIEIDPLADYYICGPAPMTTALLDELMLRSIPQEQLFVERF